MICHTVYTVTFKNLHLISTFLSHSLLNNASLSHTAIHSALLSLIEFTVTLKEQKRFLIIIIK